VALCNREGAETTTGPCHHQALPKKPLTTLPLTASDLRGLAQLGIDGVVGVTGIVESMHHTIASRPNIVGSVPEGRTTGITGLVYRAVRGTTRAVGWSLDTLLSALPHNAGTATSQREALVAALNGVWGDHLAATSNPLAIRMSLQRAGGSATGRVLVLVHGLAMNHLQWTRDDHNHGDTLARDLGLTPLYLHYNSGRHVAHNGREFSSLLDRTLAEWPVPIEELIIIGHSMGGLVARSACHMGAKQRWRSHLRTLVCLGTPHHGAPLERGGRLIDLALGVSPYAAPLARLGLTRSAGITDLRFGSVQDRRLPTPLPKGVRSFFVAATTAKKVASLRSDTLGDGLVPLASALGQHKDPELVLTVPDDHRFVITSANHFDLLSHADVYAKLRSWLT
jgi:pimeloyl-ACP methyl ester carboxylesterase